MRFSIIIPVYRSHATLRDCLQSLQALRGTNFEVILVDSSPDDACVDIARDFPAFRLIRSKQRLWMHAARRRGVASSSGEILLFTDPDCLFNSDWLEQLELALKRNHALVGGSVACATRGYWQKTAHLIKFWLWLPQQAPAPFRYAPFDNLVTANMAVKRQWYDALGGWDVHYISADTLFCYHSLARGVVPYFQATAIVHHIHTHITLFSLMRERWQRGQDFFRMRRYFKKWPIAFSWLFIFGWPMLTMRAILRRMKQALRTKTAWAFFFSLPWICLCECAWMLGQTRAAIQLLKK